jgi:hypothetical protein
MRDQLIQYVDLLFAGAADCEDIKQEILQNTLDRYDDLIDQGKSPQAAYSLAISGIGDISELLEHDGTISAPLPSVPAPAENNKKLMRAVAIGMYICSAVPLFALGNIGDGSLGLAFTCILVAAATALIILSGDKAPTARKTAPCRCSFKKSIGKVITTVGLCVYFIVSFVTGAWYITWLIFPILAALRQLINAILDLKEGE